MHVWVHMCAHLLIGLTNDYVHNMCACVCVFVFVFVCFGAAEKWDDFAETSKQRVKRNIQTSYRTHRDTFVLL